MIKEDAAKISAEVVARVFDRVVARAGVSGGRPVAEVINETLYHEMERLRKSKDSPEKRTDLDHYRTIRRELPRASAAGQKKLLQAVLERYSGEITGNFNPAVYKVATTLIPMGLTALLNGLSPRRLLSGFGNLPRLDKQLVVQGELEHLEKLYRHGTVVFVPTHSSNLDSPILGYSIFRLGLPPATYGAGLNLFTNPVIGYFMHNLGAYTVDRRKTDPLYREALKEYTTVTLEFGYHNLFFPGGTRARSNRVETRLKKGLLGTTVVAYADNLIRKKAKPKIFIVPCTISYPLVLEGATLIEDQLKAEGKSRYIIVDDEFSRLKRWVDFARGLFALDQRIYLTVSKPLDPFGNDVDEEGNSLDPRGRVIDPARYLLRDGEYVSDPVRDAEYTNGLAARVVEAYLRDNVALATNVVAFTFFEMLRATDPQGDLYRFLRTLGPETSIPLAEVEEALERVLAALNALAAKGRIRLGSEVNSGDVRSLMRNALRSFGTYHTTPVMVRRGVRLHVGDAGLILYYRNRIDGYGLAAAVGANNDGRGS